MNISSSVAVVLIFPLLILNFFVKSARGRSALLVGYAACRMLLALSTDLVWARIVAGLLAVSILAAAMVVWRRGERTRGTPP